MSKRILFLYSDAMYKGYITECEEVLKALFRKFRKTVIFTYRQVDLAPSARRDETLTILEEASKCDALIWQSGSDSFAEERIFATDGLGVFAQEHFIGGRCICSPLSHTYTKFANETIIEQRELPVSSVEKAVSLAASRAQRRKHSLLLCTDSKSMYDSAVLKEFEYALGNEKAITPIYQDFDQLVLECTYRIPTFDVLLTTEERARILTLHICSLQGVPAGNVLWHSEKVRIYRRDVFPNENLNSSVPASFLFTCAAAIADELNEKSTGEWLRRSVALALETYALSSRQDFLREVIRQINTPMRNRQVTKDDSKN